MHRSGSGSRYLSVANRHLHVLESKPATARSPEPFWESISAVRQEHTTESHLPGGQAFISLRCLVKREGFDYRLDLTLRGQFENFGEVVLSPMRGANHPLAHHMEWLAIGRNRERLAEVEPAKDDATVRIDSRERLFGGFEVVGGDQQQRRHHRLPIAPRHW